MEQYLPSFFEALLSVDKTRCARILENFYSISQTVTAIEEIICATMQKIGEGWEQGAISLAQVYMCGVICEELYQTYIRPDSVQEGQQSRVAMAGLLDHHALGKRIVLTFAKAHGYQVKDFGCGLSCEQLADLVQEHEIELLMVSTLMLHAALKVKELKAVLSERGCKTKVFVGGAPFRFDPDLWRRVGADGFCRNAMDAVEVLKREVGKNA